MKNKNNKDEINRKFKKILPGLIVELVIITSIITYGFSKSPGLFPSVFFFDFLLAAVLASFIIIGGCLVGTIFEF